MGVHLHVLFLAGCVALLLIDVESAATCADVQCVDPYENRPHSYNIPCANPKLCSAADLNTCCHRKGGSAPTPAPAPLPVPIPAPTPAPTQSGSPTPAPPQSGSDPCGTAAPSTPSPLDPCAVAPPPATTPRPTPCGDYNCPAPYVNKVNIIGIGAATTEACCDNTCKSYKCVSPYIARPEPQTIRCAGLKCTVADRQNCCTTPPMTTTTPPPDTCAGFACHWPMTMRPNPAMINCASHQCTSADIATCCKATCAGYDCPAPYVQTRNRLAIDCQNPSRCGIADLQICCHTTTTTTTTPCTTTTTTTTTPCTTTTTTTTTPCTTTTTTTTTPCSTTTTTTTTPCSTTTTTTTTPCTTTTTTTTTPATTTTPCTTLITTTTPETATCKLFACGQYPKKPNPESIPCHHPQGCTSFDEKTCCIVPTPKPDSSPCATVHSADGPCGTVAPRLYDARVPDKRGVESPRGILGLPAMLVGGFALASLIGVAFGIQVRRRRSRSTRMTSFTPLQSVRASTQADAELGRGFMRTSAHPGDELSRQTELEVSPLLIE